MEFTQEEKSLVEKELEDLFESLTEEHFQEAFRLIEQFDFCEDGKELFYKWFERKIDTLEDLGEFELCLSKVMTIRNVLNLAFHLVVCDRY